MNARKLLVVSVLTLLLASPACSSHETRSAGPAEDEKADGAGSFDHAYSAGFFVGINHFKDKTIAPVDYAVDDAVDLAWNLSLNPRINLLSPKRVVLVLSGSANKPDSKDRLDELKSAGAVIIRRATRDDIARLLQQQAAAAGRQGLFIAAFATHGYSDEGVPYVLASSSIFGVPQTALSTAKVFEIASEAGAERSLMFVDACRERLRAASRSGEADPEAAAALMAAMQPVEGQAVFFAAAAGKYAYDDPAEKNGVFTGAVLAGLNCGAETDGRGFVTVNTLSDFVEKRVHNWVMIHRRSGGSATQTNMDGGTKDMPLVQCGKQPPVIAGLMPRADFRNPDHLKLYGTSLEVLAKDETPLWKREVGGRIAPHAEVVDLDGNGTNEVVVNTGQLIVFDGAGAEWWRSPADPRLSITKFITANLFRNGKREIVALYDTDDGSAGSRLVIFPHDGKRAKEYLYPGRLQWVVTGKETSHHSPKLVVGGVDDDVANVFLLNPNKLARPLWSGVLSPPSQRIEKLAVIDYDNDTRQDISITTNDGSVLYLDYAGDVLSPANGANFIRMGNKQATIRR